MTNAPQPTVLGLTDEQWQLSPPELASWWGGRTEAPPRVAERLIATVALIRELGGPFDSEHRGWRVTPATGGWGHLRGAPESLDDLSAWTDFLAGIEDHGFGGVDRGGFVLKLVAGNASYDPDRFLTLLVSVGHSGSPTDRPANTVSLSQQVIAYGATSLMDHFDAEAARRTLLGVIELWRPDAACVGVPLEVEHPHQHLALDAEARPPIGAVTWLAPHVADLSAQIPGASVETSLGGALLTVGTPASARPADVRPVRDHLHQHGLLRALPPTQPAVGA